MKGVSHVSLGLLGPNKEAERQVASMRQVCATIGSMHNTVSADRTSPDIVLERTDDFNDHIPSLNLTELWVFGIPCSEDGSRFVLTNKSSQRWEMSDFIEL